MLSVLLCLYSYGEFKNEHLSVPLKFVLPWNQTTPVGYYGELCVAVAFIGTYMIMNGIIVLIFISICLQHQALYQMFQHLVRKLNRPNEKHNNKDVLRQIIEFQVTTRNWFSHSSAFYSLIIMNEVIYSLLTLAICIFRFERLLKNFDMDTILYVNGVMSCISTLFLFCYFGKLASYSYEKMISCLYEDINWTELPNGQQKHLILMIAMAQKPVFYHGFHIMKLDLKTFATLMNKTYTFYMIFKTFSE
ncbi:odorant receptor 82a-like [Contarinia nasturtii]|uniref:odorant receptor 82a-like n=1 Tax=Contarinia nasturtii TaxID=265458 RepID=UPI0012D3C3A0|nr:odorant receptor 82a-like [Contarinia nasturtii]